jgi:hypothetical protein
MGVESRLLVGCQLYVSLTGVFVVNDMDAIEQLESDEGEIALE